MTLDVPLLVIVKLSLPANDNCTGVISFHLMPSSTGSAGLSASA